MSRGRVASKQTRETKKQIRETHYQTQKKTQLLSVVVPACRCGLQPPCPGPWNFRPGPMFNNPHAGFSQWAGQAGSKAHSNNFAMPSSNPIFNDLDPTIVKIMDQAEQWHTYHFPKTKSIRAIKECLAASKTWWRALPEVHCRLYFIEGSHPFQEGGDDVVPSSFCVLGNRPEFMWD